MTSRFGLHVATAATLGLLIAAPVRGDDAPAAAPVKGDLWEVTSQMSMEGMPMALPAQKVKVCAPKTWTEPPAPANERQKCTNSDFQVDGPRATWKVTCAAPHAMTGTGEITRDGDAAYSGTIKFASAQGNMTIKLDGQRTGDCDNPQK